MANDRLYMACDGCGAVELLAKSGAEFLGIGEEDAERLAAFATRHLPHHPLRYDGHLGSQPGVRLLTEQMLADETGHGNADRIRPHSRAWWTPEWQAREDAPRELTDEDWARIAWVRAARLIHRMATRLPYTDKAVASWKGPRSTAEIFGP